MSDNNTSNNSPSPLPGDDEYILPPLPDKTDKDKRAERLAKARGIRGTDSWRPWYFDALVAYKADPTDIRTMEQFAKDLGGVTAVTLHRYIKSDPPGFWIAVDGSRPKYHSRIRDAVWSAILANIKKSFNDRKLALQLLGDFVEKTENTTTVRTPEEKRARVEELLARLANRPPQIEQK